MEDTGVVSNNVDDPKNEAVLGADGEIRSTRVACNWLFRRRLGEECVHLAEAPYLRTGRIYSEYEDEDDGKQDTSVEDHTVPRDGNHVCL